MESVKKLLNAKFGKERKEKKPWVHPPARDICRPLVFHFSGCYFITPLPSNTVTTASTCGASTTTSTTFAVGSSCNVSCAVDSPFIPLILIRLSIRPHFLMIVLSFSCYLFDFPLFLVLLYSSLFLFSFGLAIFSSIFPCLFVTRLAHLILIF